LLCEACNLFEKVVAQRATNAAVAHLHHLFAHAVELTIAHAAACFDKLRVDVDLTHVVHDDRDAHPLAVAQHVVEQRGLSGTKKTREHRDGQTSGEMCGR
jgi:hypothetical protein